MTMNVYTARRYTERGICYANFVCPSARLSVTRVDCIKTAERIIEILSPSYRPIILVFRHQGLLLHPNGAAQYKGGSDFFTKMRLYLGNGNRYKHIYYRRRIQSRMCSIE